MSKYEILGVFTGHIATLSNKTESAITKHPRAILTLRKDAIEQFTAGGRPELAESEQAELVILEAYLPTMMSEDDVKTIVLAKQSEMAVTDKKDAGKLMAEVMKDLKGKADGSVVKNAVDGLFV